MAKAGKFMTLDSKELVEYIDHLKRVDYNAFNNGTKAIVRQAANDIKSVYSAATPIRQGDSKKKKSGKYGATKGNLRRSLRVFPKKQKDPFTVEFTVGFKTHAYGAAQQKLKDGKKVIDGYYGWMVAYGLAGRREGIKFTQNVGFIQRARERANKVIDGGMTERAEAFFRRKLERTLKK